jgi:predicted RNA-binding protein with RPS1 domain
MAKTRGFIIAIENYPQIQQGFANELAGSTASALAFRNWLITTKKVDAADIHFCAEAGVEGRTAGVTRKEIGDEMVRLGIRGHDKTDQLYVFYCGHGFTFTDEQQNRREDVLICADFTTYGNAGESCFKLSEMQWFLLKRLGGRTSEHFYFIDACRTPARSSSIRLGGLGRDPTPVSGLGEPAVFTLYSTQPGAQAAVANAFPSALIDGLNGKGRAKMWSENFPGQMVVLFRSLANYVERRILGQPVDESVLGRREGAILQIKPVPQYSCDVSIEGATKADQVSFELADAKQRVIDTGDFAGARHTLHSTPDLYDLKLTIPGAVVTNIDPLPFELYENCEVRFQKSEGRTGGAPTPPAAHPVSPVAFTLPRDSAATLHSFTTGETIALSSSGMHALIAGDYVAKITDLEGTPIGRRSVTVRPGSTTSVDLTEFKSSPIRDALLSQIQGDHRSGAVDFSETLGPLPDQDLGLWLSIIGASRIVPGASNFSKLKDLPLASFSDLVPGDTGVFVLAGFANPDTSFELGLEAAHEGIWFQPEAISGFPGLRQFKRTKVWERPAQPESQSMPITFHIGDRTPITILSSMLPNRITLITLSIDEDGQQQIGQYLLPVEHLVGALPEQVRYLIKGRGYLRSTKFIAQAQRLFGKRRDIFVGHRRRTLEELLYLKWFDPIIAIMAAYELIRTGERDKLGEVVENLEKFFPELPDTWAIKRLMNGDAPFRGWPIFSDGLLAFTEQFNELPYSADRLDYLSAWTLWRGVSVGESSRQVEIGQTYQGRVVSTKEFGAFVEIFPGKEGLVHISELADSRVKRTEDVVKAGDLIWVKCIGIDEKGRIKLSRKAALKEHVEHEKGEAAPTKHAV